MWCVMAPAGVRLSPAQDPPYCDIRSSVRPLLSAGYGDKFHTECRRHGLLYKENLSFARNLDISLIFL